MFDKLAIVSVSRRCNHRCVWCSEGDVHTGELTPLDVADEMFERLKAAGYDAVNFMGAETTTRPDVAELFSRVRSRGLGVALTTNGIRFADRRFADEVLPLLDCMELSLPTTAADVYREVTGRAHLPRVFAALENIGRHMQRSSLVLVLNVVTARPNANGPSEVARWLAESALGARAWLHLLRARREGRARPELLLDLGACAAAFRPAVKLARDAGRLVGFRGLPPCVLPEEAAHDLGAFDFVQRADVTYLNKAPLERGVSIADNANLDRKGRVRPAPCDGCALAAACPGVDPDVENAAPWLRPFDAAAAEHVLGAIRANPIATHLERNRA